tara:strand:- start:4100 stop:4330 length:231 start_codon:yes stop_codon:yes gene_type:complete
MDEIDSIVLPPDARLKQSVVYGIVDKICTHQSTCKQTGSVHGFALFAAYGELVHALKTWAATTRWTRLPAICGLTR